MVSQEEQFLSTKEGKKSSQAKSKKEIEHKKKENFTGVYYDEMRQKVEDLVLSLQFAVNLNPIP